MTCKHSFDEIELAWANGLCAYCLLYALAEAQKDAERYQFVRNMDSEDLARLAWSAISDVEFDAEIDAAAKEQKNV